MGDALLSVTEVAKFLGIRRHGVLSLIRTEQLHGIDVSLRPGGRPTWRVSREDVDSFIRRRTHSATPKRRRRQRTEPKIKEYF